MEAVAEQTEEKEPVLKVEEPAVNIEDNVTEPKAVAQGSNDGGEQKLVGQTDDQEEATSSPSVEPKIDTAKAKKPKQSTEEVKQESDFPI